jgi:hypothetical protein
MKYKKWLLALTFLLQPFILWWYFTPSYLDIYIPIPSYHGDIWNHTHRTAFSYNDESGEEYVLRRDGTAYAEVVGWKSTKDGLHYIDHWLVERGWERTEIYTQGDPILPESEFLKFGETYAVYTRPEDRSGFGGNARGAMGRVTVAVWPICINSENCCVDGYEVVIASAVPSFRLALIRGLDD